MARGKPVPKPTVTRDVEYINIDIAKDMRPALLKWLESNPDVWDMLEKTADSGLKIGLSFDSYNECFQASITKLPERGMQGKTLVLIGRGGNLFQAVQALMYKYWVVLQCELENAEQRNQRGVTDFG